MILWRDDMRKSYFRLYEEAKSDQKLFAKNGDFETARICKENANSCWDSYKRMVRELMAIGVDTGDWDQNDLQFILN